MFIPDVEAPGVGGPVGVLAAGAGVLPAEVGVLLRESL